MDQLLGLQWAYCRAAEFISTMQIQERLLAAWKGHSHIAKPRLSQEKTGPASIILI